MRSLEDARARWHVTTKHLTSLEDLRKTVKLEGDDSPCVAGLRSVCWKTFLLFQSPNTDQWPQTLADSRSAYSALRGHLLRFVENPDELGSSLDPLDDDLNSPWNTARQDDEMRAEIFQDVERCMPEEPYFRQPETQRMLLDILFVFCKINQDVGYRQGMHEVLAPLLWVIDQDSIDTSEDSTMDAVMKTSLDQTYVEHDAFTLLSLVMRSAKSFYELGEPEKKAGLVAVPSSAPQQGSPIVERSRRIHEDYLARVDPELSKHLTNIEILPQIFLIRWIRLLFGREFPFEDLLGLWDTLFAEDPGLESIDLVCVAMLLRIRWQLLDSTYSFALMLLLKYPPPSPPHGPKTFIEDAMYLKNNLTPSGGASLIKKYSNRSPDVQSSSRPSTPSDLTLSPRQKLMRTRSPLPSAASFLQQQGGVGELFQGAARGLLDRGERLGINQAVRDAVGEAKKNMQTLQTSRSSSFKGRTSTGSSRWSLDDGRTIQSPQSLASAFNARNRQLAGMLEQAMSDLRTVSSSNVDDKEAYVKAMELAIAKVEFVKVYLEDSTMPLPPPASEMIQSDPLQELVTKLPQPEVVRSPEGDAPDVSESAPSEHVSGGKQETPVLSPAAKLPESASKPVPVPTTTITPAGPDVLKLDSSPTIKEAQTRPTAPLPTRSSIAQSNFAWMLESNDSSNSLAKSPPKSNSPFLKSGRKPTSGASREKAAFLFGEESEDILDSKGPRFPARVDVDEGFNMGAIKGSKSNRE